MGYQVKSWLLDLNPVFLFFRERLIVGYRINFDCFLIYIQFYPLK